MAAPTLTLPGVTDITATSARPFVTLTYETGFTEAQLISSLFGSNEVGALWLPGPDTCFTDTEGTTAAGDGSFVRRINDNSGNEIHATQTLANTSHHPTLRQDLNDLWYLDFTNNHLNFTLVNAVFCCIAAQRVEPASFSTACLLGGDGLAINDGGSNASYDHVWAWDGTNTIETDVNNVDPKVITVLGIGASGYMRVNGTDHTTNSDGTGLNALDLSRIGSRTDIDNRYFGNIYGIVIRDTAPTTQQITDTEAFMAERIGITL